MPTLCSYLYEQSPPVVTKLNRMFNIFHVFRSKKKHNKRRRRCKTVTPLLSEIRGKQQLAQGADMNDDDAKLGKVKMPSNIECDICQQEHSQSPVVYHPLHRSYYCFHCYNDWKEHQQYLDSLMNNSAQSELVIHTNENSRQKSKHSETDSKSDMQITHRQQSIQTSFKWHECKPQIIGDPMDDFASSDAQNITSRHSAPVSINERRMHHKEPATKWKRHQRRKRNSF